jgi:uncharacterized integral membrane protein
MPRKRSTREHDDLNLERTRASSVWVAVVVGVVFLILLIDFIAQNNRKVSIVLMAGAARIIQLRVTTRRHNKAVRQAAASDSVVAPSVPASQGEAESVQTQHNP